MVLGMAAGLGAMMQDLEAWQGNTEDGGAGLNDEVEDEGEGLVIIVEAPNSE